MEVEVGEKNLLLSALPQTAHLGEIRKHHFNETRLKLLSIFSTRPPYRAHDLYEGARGPLSHDSVPDEKKPVKNLALHHSGIGGKPIENLAGKVALLGH